MTNDSVSTNHDDSKKAPEQRPSAPETPPQRGKPVSEGGTFDPSGRFDLSTTAGTKAWEVDFRQRKAIAEDFHRLTFEEIRDGLESINATVLSVLVDLADQDMGETAGQMAKIANASYCISSLIHTGEVEAPEVADDLPSPRAEREAPTPSRGFTRLDVDTQIDAIFQALGELSTWVLARDQVEASTEDYTGPIASIGMSTDIIRQWLRQGKETSTNGS